MKLGFELRSALKQRLSHSLAAQYEFCFLPTNLLFYVGDKGIVTAETYDSAAIYRPPQEMKGTEKARPLRGRRGPKAATGGGSEDQMHGLTTWKEPQRGRRTALQRDRLMRPLK